MVLMNCGVGAVSRPSSRSTVAGSRWQRLHRDRVSNFHRLIWRPVRRRKVCHRIGSGRTVSRRLHVDRRCHGFRTVKKGDDLTGRITVEVVETIYRRSTQHAPMVTALRKGRRPDGLHALCRRSALNGFGRNGGPGRWLDRPFDPSPRRSAGALWRWAQ
jgi:uncharacterized protein YwbE